MPTNVETTNYSFGSLAFGNAVECIFDNAPDPHVSLEKQLSAAGRIFDRDEFRFRIRIRRSNGTVAATSSTGAGAAQYSYTPDASGFDPNVAGL